MVDVLVIGAGPAGIAACSTLIESNMRVNVTLIDRHSQPGSKACAGGLTEEGWVAAGIDPLDPPSFAQTFEEIEVTSDVGKVSLKKGGQPMLVTVDRSMWQSECIESLRSKGVEISLGERLLKIGDKVAETSKGKREYDWLVGADGASSRTRRLMGLKHGAALRGKQIRIKASSAAPAGIETHTPKIWFDSNIPCPGYGWSFPWRDEIRLGLGAHGKWFKQGDFKVVFTNWLKKRGIDVSNGEVQSANIGCDYSGYRFGRVILAGDAAGLASPLTGEGIAQALVSGKEVAREIIDPTYRSFKIAELGRRHRRTHDTLGSCFWGGTAMVLAPYLLRVPLIRKETLRRYV